MDLCLGMVVSETSSYLMNGNENFLKNIITGDETWVYGYDVETKMQLSQWMGKGSP